jgi:hypothetical protein
MKKSILTLLATGALLMSACGFAQTSTPEFIEKAYQAANHTNLSPQAVEMALKGYEWAIKHATVHNKDILTIVDFTISSAKPRLYVIDLKQGDVLMALHVSHGSGSGNGAYATSFSNRANSLQSSIGVFVTQNTYYGQHGESLRINGLEESNNNVLKRHVVVHSANYVTPEYIQQHGKAGPSWGCFAVNPQKSKLLINYIKDGSVLYAYGQSKEYLATTKIATVASAPEEDGPKA